MVEVSIIIPIYKESPFLEENLSILKRNSFQDFELILVVDRPTKEFEKTLEKVKEDKKIKIDLSYERRGKINALKRGLEISSGKYIFFFDADVKLPKKYDFIERIVKLLEKYEFVCVKYNTIKKGFFGKCFYYENLAYSFIFYLWIYLAGRPFFSYGPAWFVRRYVAEEILEKIKPSVTEDLEIGIQIFRNRYKSYFEKNYEVFINPPRNFREWYEQRKRWGYGFWEWVFKNWKDLIILFITMPIPIFFSVMLFLPFLLLLFLLILSKNLFFFFSTIFLTYVSSVLPIATIPSFFVLYPILLVGFIKYIPTLVIFFILSFSICKFLYGNVLGERISFPEYSIFFWIYNPILLIIYVGSAFLFILSLINKKFVKLDWKV